MNEVDVKIVEEVAFVNMVGNEVNANFVQFAVIIIITTDFLTLQIKRKMELEKKKKKI